MQIGIRLHDVAPGTLEGAGEKSPMSRDLPVLIWR